MTSSRSSNSKRKYDPFQTAATTEHAAWEHRDNVPERVVEAVLRRDNWQCQLCGTGGDNRLQLHHWFSFRSHGGAHVQENLVTVCHKCHDDVHAGRKDVVVVETQPGLWAAFPATPTRRKTR